MSNIDKIAQEEANKNIEIPKPKARYFIIMYTIKLWSEKYKQAVTTKQDRITYTQLNGKYVNERKFKDEIIEIFQGLNYKRHDVFIENIIEVTKDDLDDFKSV